MAETKRRYRMGLLFVAGCCMLKIGNPKKKIFRRGRPNTQGPRPEYSLKQAEFGRLSARAEINTVYHICPNSNGALLLASTSSNTETAVPCIPSTRYRSKSKNGYFISETERRTYFVTKSIGIGPKRVRDALQQVAEAFQWLYGIPAPSGVEIGSIEGVMRAIDCSRTTRPPSSSSRVKKLWNEREARSDMDESPNPYSMNRAGGISIMIADRTLGLPFVVKWLQQFETIRTGLVEHGNPSPAP
ncbi:hypothetical protein K438DRAFT_1785097 [Mycena galopus ATCC 62051]|nr:hypothetical protein K438DRAFT_1785097 [Mycena galopus ATCC 62051]